LQPIGTIHTPYSQIENMPIQPRGAKHVEGSVHVREEYAEGLKDLDGFSHIYLIYRFHKAGTPRLTVIPFLDTTPRGVFATRSPLRPNPIGISIVEVVRIEGAVIVIKGVDILDKTPLLDIKPYIPAFDAVENAASGWMTARPEDVSITRSDDRFR